MFDLSVGKLLFLAVIAIVVFGPERMAEGATSDLREGLGPEFSNFDVSDLHPGNFVRKHLFDDLPGDGAKPSAAGSAATLAAEASVASGLAPGESPPYDAEAT